MVGEEGDDVKLHETEVRVPAPDCEIRASMITPVDDGRWPRMLLYTDIFQRTDSTLQTARRLASAGFVVCVPEIYPRGALAGVALEFDDAGKQSGLNGAASHHLRADCGEAPESRSMILLAAFCSWRSTLNDRGLVRRNRGWPDRPRSPARGPPPCRPRTPCV
jgi:dienelactone hydrolase